VFNNNNTTLVWQSSALGFLLAQKHFTNPLVAVPSAVSVVAMAVSFLVSFSLSLMYMCHNSLALTVNILHVGTSKCMF
jgi:hypothetical protein